MSTRGAVAGRGTTPARREGLLDLIAENVDRHVSTLNSERDQREAWGIQALTATHRTAGGAAQAIPLPEAESAIEAAGRIDPQALAAGLEGAPQVLEVTGDLLLRHPHPDRHLARGQRTTA